MEDGQSHMTERILTLTLDIICLLTGERCAVVKMAAMEGLLQGMYPPLSGEQSPITAPPPSPTSHRNMEQKVLEVINQVVELLTGELQRGERSHVIYTGEEKIKAEDDGKLEHVEGHQELCVAAMMEERLVDGSGSPPQMSSQDSSQEMANQSRSDGGMSVKLEDEGEAEGAELSGDQWCVVEVGMVVEQSPAVDTDSSGGILTFPNSRPGAPSMPRSAEPWQGDGTEGGQSGEKEFWCPDCDRYFRTKQTLQRHRKSHSGVKPFSCPECGKCFGEKTNLVRHQSSHTAERPFSCSDCGRSFADKSEVTAHENCRTGRDIHSCSECGKLFAEKSKLLAPQSDHSGEEPYTCSECRKSFVEKPQLLHHQRLHTGVMPYSCSECGMSFRLKSRLHLHQRAHTAEKPYRCSECGKTFSWISNLLKHQQRGHRPEPDGRHEASPEKPQAILDQRAHRGETPGKQRKHRKLLPCSMCDRMFADKSQLIAHRRRHASQKPHSCAECGESFVFKAELDVHMRFHTGQKVYSCLTCGNSYIFKSQLRKHWRIHTGEKRHPCSECERSFVWKSELDLHMRRHRGEKPFPCSECGKCFVLRSKLNQHQKIHSREKPFHCPECGQGFHYESQLTKHRDQHHREKPSSSTARA